MSSPSVSLRQNQTQPLIQVRTTRPGSIYARRDRRRFDSAMEVSDRAPHDDDGQTRKLPFRHRLVDQRVEVILHLSFISLQNVSPATASVRPRYGFVKLGKPI